MKIGLGVSLRTPSFGNFRFATSTFPTWTKVEKQRLGSKSLWNQFGLFQNEDSENYFKRVWHRIPFFQHGPKWENIGHIPNPFESFCVFSEKRYPHNFKRICTGPMTALPGFRPFCIRFLVSYQCLGAINFNDFLGRFSFLQMPRSTISDFASPCRGNWKMTPHHFGTRPSHVFLYV